VQDLYVKYANAARELTQGEQNHEAGWVLNTDEVGPVMVKWAAAPDPTWAEKLRRMVPDFKTMTDAHGKVQEFIGGPNPLTSMLLTGALTGGLGYGSGWILNKLFPQWFNKRTPAAFGTIGALGGAAVPGFIHGVPALRNQGLSGLWTQQPLQGGPAYKNAPNVPAADMAPGANVARRTAGGTWDAKTKQWAYPHGTENLPKPGTAGYEFGAKDVRTGQYGPIPDPQHYERVKGASSALADVLDRLTDQLGVTVDKDAFTKCADLSGGTLPQFSTNEWGEVVMRDPFLDNPEKAIAAGVPAAAGAMRGSNLVSPRDVASVAVNAGLGYGYGYLGSLAGKFLGLTPPVQKGIQRAGLLAGAIRGITGML
jgi:hypothetical protein